MVFNDIGGSLNQLTQKLSMIDPQELQQMLSVPNFDSFSSQFSNILPQNLIQTGTDGIQQILNPTNLANQLSQTAQQALPQIAQQLQNQLQGVAGGIPSKIISAAQSGELQQLGSQLQQITEQFSSVSSQQMVDLLNQNIQTGQLSNLLQASQGGLPSAQFSPKQIRDLANPENLAAKTQQLADVAGQGITSTAQTMAQNVANNPVFNNSAQTNLQQQSAPQFSGDNTEGKAVRVHLTSYWAKGTGTDVDSASYRSSSGRRLQEGISCAVDPDVIPIGSTVNIPGVGTRLAVDIGGAVKGKVASGGRLPIIDIFYETEKNALRANTDKDTTVTYIPPKTKWKYAKNASPTYGAA
jgi:3D (Asp-Asp-Asp) domain-containing protein